MVTKLVMVKMSFWTIFIAFLCCRPSLLNQALQIVLIVLCLLQYCSCKEVAAVRMFLMLFTLKASICLIGTNKKQNNNPCCTNNLKCLRFIVLFLKADYYNNGGFAFFFYLFAQSARQQMQHIRMTSFLSHRATINTKSTKQGGSGKQKTKDKKHRQINIKTTTLARN